MRAFEDLWVGRLAHRRLPTSSCDQRARRAELTQALGAPRPDRGPPGGSLRRQRLARSTSTVGGGADYAAVAELEHDGKTRPAAMWRALRLDPRHAAEVSVLYALPQLMPHVEHWRRTNAPRHPTEPPDKMARRVLRHSTSVARRGGLITGSSFYVGMPPAMAMIYFEQLTAVLRIAAVYRPGSHRPGPCGRDPCHPGSLPNVDRGSGRAPACRAACDAAAGRHRCADDRGRGAPATLDDRPARPEGRRCLADRRGRRRRSKLPHSWSR